MKLVMRIETRDFGTVTVEEDDIVTFVTPIFGFDGLTKYVFLFDQSVCAQFVWLQSVEEKDVCFVLADPSFVMAAYAPTLPRQVVEVIDEGEKLLWLIVVVNENFEKSTVNLKSPVVLNPVQRKAMQVILDENYSLQYPLIQEEKGGV